MSGKDYHEEKWSAGGKHPSTHANRPASRPSGKSSASAGVHPSSRGGKGAATQTRSSAKAGSATPGGSRKQHSGANKAKRPDGNAAYDHDLRMSAKQTPRQNTVANERRFSPEEQELRSSEYAKQIARRRRQRKYRKNRSLLMFLYYAAIAIAVVSVAVIMSTTVLFNITEVRLETAEDVPYTEEQIRQLCTVEAGQNIFTAPIDETAQAITQGLPYIETCNVVRKLPSTVVIETSAAEIMGLVRNESGQCFIVSTGCRALDVVADVSSSDVPVLNGVTLTSATVGATVTADNQTRLENASQIITIMAGYGIKLESVTFSQSGYITADYDGRVELLIGTATNLEDKLELASTLINEGKITKNESGELDLTIAKQATFRPDYLVDKE